MEDPNRAEAERLLGISEKLLQTRDLIGSRAFAILAQETEPLLDSSDQILAVTDVLLAAEKRVNNHHDWYSILHLDRRSDDQELIKKLSAGVDDCNVAFRRLWLRPWHPKFSFFFFLGTQTAKEQIKRKIKRFLLY